jgi:hypothetical protein
MASLRERGLRPRIRVVRESLRSRLARLEEKGRAVAEPDEPQEGAQAPTDAAARNTFEGSDHMERTQR